MKAADLARVEHDKIRAASKQPARGLHDAHQSKLDKLKELQSVDFDKEYVSMQVDAHRDAVDLFERYSKGGDDKDLQAFATKHLPHLREHLKMAQELATTASNK